MTKDRPLDRRSEFPYNLAMTKFRIAAEKTSPLGSAMEDYLRAIYQLQNSQPVVTTTALAQAMRVSPASATNMIKKLAEMKLVRHSPYHGVTLTHPGEKIALEILRHHRLIELFLNETLGIPWDEVHAEAHKLEHVLSDNLEEHIAEFLGNPTEDPHGDPIPTKSGAIAEMAQQRLGDLPPGSRATIRRVTDQDPEHLRHFSNLGLVPSATVAVLQSEPFGGPLRVQLESGEERILDGAFAREIWVEPPGASASEKSVHRIKNPYGTLRSPKPRRSTTR